MNNKTYAGIPEEFSKQEQAKIVLIPVSYDGTNSLKGPKNGPEAFLNASEKLNLYDIETDTEVYQQGIFLAEAVTENQSAEAMVNAVHQSTKKYIKKNKFVTLIGGDHTVSIGAIRAFNECFDSLTVLHMDAHINLLKTFQGSAFHKNCALYEASQTTNLIQVGIRSMKAKEKTVVDNEKVYYAHEMAVDDSWMDSAIDQMTGNVFISLDLFVLFFFLEIAVIPKYLLIGIWGSGKKEYSANKLALMLMGGSALVLVGILELYFSSGHSFDLLSLSKLNIPIETQRIIFPLLFVGFGVFTALFPFHTWSPDGHASAPTAVSMLHAGVLMKLGGYGVFRVAMFLLPAGALHWSWFFIILATIGVIYGALGAIRQTDLKRIIAYSSIAHMNLVTLGIFSFNK